MCVWGGIESILDIAFSPWLGLFMDSHRGNGVSVRRVTEEPPSSIVCSCLGHVTSVLVPYSFAHQWT